jgi:Putative transposase/Transposase zinc-binding domain
MRYNDPLRQILTLTGSYWDTDKFRPGVRRAFRKALQCRTPALGGEVYSSGNQEKIVYHTCKARPCSSCGYRATAQWQRERWAALPDVPYKGITFTMPDVLWPLFRENPHLARALPALAAAIIQSRATAQHGLHVGVIAILHTFNGKLEFNSHVHVMVTAGGLHGSTGTWVRSIYHDHDRLMKAWRKAVIALLRAALLSGQLNTDMIFDEVEALLVNQERRWWRVKVQSFKSRQHFLLYAGRYARRPPIAQYRITSLENGTVTFWYKDKRLRRRVYVQCSLQQFVKRWEQHVPERYQHAVRSFGLFGPRAVGEISAAVMAILKQEPRPRPKPRRWAESIKRDYGRDPLLDDTGQRMRWARRIAPQIAAESNV